MAIAVSSSSSVVVAPDPGRALGSAGVQHHEEPDQRTRGAHAQGASSLSCAHTAPCTTSRSLGSSSSQCPGGSNCSCCPSPPWLQQP